MALVTLAEFKDSVYSDANRSWTTPQLQQALSFGESRFYSGTGRDKLGFWLEPRELSVTLHSTGLPSIRCPFPVLELVAVLVDGSDITSECKHKGNYIFRNGSTFGVAPASVETMTYVDVEVTAKFGDSSPRIVRDADQMTTIPWDVKDCVMRIAWHWLKRERIEVDQGSSRNADTTKVRFADMSRDTQIRSVMADWSKVENTGAFDWR